ncbi:translation initiation factor IF-2 [Rhodospirillaceae bacterium SYSU D60014]|uniref:translation initiation factor IF-2 n=1 Tax=Virgifigura deserti TaxID=2268457 RepID=UPI000E67194D
MNRNEQEPKKPLTLSRPGRLELKKTVEAGQVRQSFPHGRSKTVTVEVKRKRTYAPGDGGRMTEVQDAEPGLPAEEAPVVASADLLVDERGHPHRHLTAGERATRMRALEDARRDDELRRQAEAEARQRAAELERQQEEERARQREAAAAGKPQATEATEEHAPAATAPEAEAPAPAATPAAQAPRAAQTAEEEEQPTRAKRPGARPAPAKPATPVRRGEPRRRAGKLTIVQALDDNDQERMRSLASVRRAREREKQRVQQLRSEGQKVIRDVVIPETITVQELANRMAERGADVIKALMRMGIMATINQSLDADTAEVIAAEFGHRIKRVSSADVEVGLMGDEDEAALLQSRPPVVTVMGHVDHGKTSLLDALRSSDVAAREAGGITQHIGAYQVTRPSGQKITFIDTPGHAAFTEMRARGANVTDIVVLVVAADDGIMQQTVEAIHHARAAGVPVIVAINKMDKPDANPDRVRQELLQHEIVVEQMGGDVLTVEVSAKARTNLDKLEEAILLQAELLELRANPDRPASGAVVEARLERGRGAVATLLVQRGTIRVGDIFVAGSEWGRVRALINDRGENIDSAGPAMPVEVLGLQGTPMAGDDFVVVENEARARQISEFRQHRQREAQAATAGRGTLEQMFSKIAAGETKELPVVVKSDVQGSLEAITASLGKLGTDEVSARVLHAAVGGINESDVTLARASGAMIIGFNVRANPQAREMARRDNVDIRYYSIIYNVVDDIRAALSGLLAPAIREKFLGYAQIRQVFAISRIGKIAGCMVTEGVVRRGAKVRLLRDDVVIHEGNLKTLKRFKDEVREVKEGYECGMAFENYHDIQEGDVIECFEMEEVARDL